MCEWTGESYREKHVSERHIPTDKKKRVERRAMIAVVPRVMALP